MNSSFPNISLSKDNFTNCNWEEVVKNSEEKTCLDYSHLFQRKYLEAEKQGDTELQATLEVLSSITFPLLDSGNLDQPFNMDFINNKISNECFAVLKEWVSDIFDYELKARIADVLWIRDRDDRDYRMAKIAIDSYLKSDKLLDQLDNWILLSRDVSRIERAIRLAYQANQKTHQDEVITYIESVLDKCNGEDLSSLSLSATLMELLQEFKKGDPLKYAPISEKAARRAETEHNWDKARNYWQIAIKWHQKSQDDNQKRSASLSHAETYVKEAEDKINQAPPSYLAASYFLRQAIEAFRKNIGGNQTRIEQIHRILLDYQKESITELQSCSQQIDISDIAEQARQKVKGKELHEALETLALSFESPSVSEIKQTTQKIIATSIFGDIFPPVYINETGKTIGQNPSLENETGKTIGQNPSLEDPKDYTIAISYQHFHAQANIEPARDQINLEHCVKVSDFDKIVTNNPFVPSGREEIYARGLHAGLTGDFLVAAHLLIPQIEHSLRCLLERRGVITSFLDNKGIQDEHIMSVLFGQHKEELEDIFLEDIVGEDRKNIVFDLEAGKNIVFDLEAGKNIVFDLIGLLNRKGFGSNLRNLIAHGLLSSNSFCTPSVIYLWWLTLRLCYLPIISNRESSQTNEQE